MQQIKIQTPAKINLTLEVLNKRDDGFHNIQSIMHAISLSDYLTINVEQNKSSQNEIILRGNSTEIPYDEKNIVFKAAKLYLESASITDAKIKIYIEKNIPVCAGLAGGSTNASGTLYGLNKLFNKFNHQQLHNLAATLGSDLNFCLDGGCAKCTSRGEITTKLPSASFKLSLIKPKNLGITAKEAYQKFAQLTDKSNPNNTEKLQYLLLNNKFDKNLIYNSLETAVLNDYEQIKLIKEKLPTALMSGSGPTFFVLDKEIDPKDWNPNEFLIYNNLVSVNFGSKTI